MFTSTSTEPPQGKRIRVVARMARRAGVPGKGAQRPTRADDRPPRLVRHHRPPAGRHPFRQRLACERLSDPLNQYLLLLSGMLAGGGLAVLYSWAVAWIAK